MSKPKPKSATKPRAARAVEGELQDQDAAGTDQAKAASGEKSMTSEKPRTAREVDVIRQDRALHLVPGMFVMGGNPTLRSRSKQVIQGTELIFKFSPMSGYDLRMLHGLSALMQGHMRGQIISYDAQDDQNAAIEAWTALGPMARSFGRYVTTLYTTKRQLAEVVSASGVQNGAALDRTYESLKRLAEVTIHMRSPDGRAEYTTQLVSIGRVDDRIAIILNPRIVAAVSERVAGAFSTISMRDVRRTKGESTLLLLSRLCGFVDEGNTTTVGQDKLETYIYGDVLPAGAEHAEQRKVRRKVILKACGELGALGWEVVEIGGRRGVKPQFRFTRPRMSAAERAQLDRGQLSLNLPPAVPESKRSK